MREPQAQGPTECLKSCHSTLTAFGACDKFASRSTYIVNPGNSMPRIDQKHFRFARSLLSSALIGGLAFAACGGGSSPPRAQSADRKAISSPRAFALPVPKVSFIARTDYPVGRSPQSVAVGDFNGDRVQDLATADFYSSTVSVLLGMGDGTFASARSYPVGWNPVHVALGDVNGDGVPDLIAVNCDCAVNPPTRAGSVSVLLGNRDGSFQQARNFVVGSGPRFVAVGDFNRDGIQDVAVANRDSGDVSLLLGNGDGTFRAARTLAVGGGPTSVAVGDFNRDGVQDLVVATYGEARTYSPGTGGPSRLVRRSGRRRRLLRRPALLSQTRTFCLFWRGEMP